uniref:DNA-binding protein ESCAROLA n=2 Tax=Cajanus cajan TaxID=3821 RepID=A0A151TX75_CAJCA|nr:Putative DNA-binding protein ESCAROLA [Cajanus cajan]
MIPFVLEILGRSDVVEALAWFSRRKNTGLCVLSGSRIVANVTLRQPSVTPGATVTFHDRFDVLSLSATLFLHASPTIALSAFAVSLVGPPGQIISEKEPRREGRRSEKEARKIREKNKKKHELQLTI